MESGSKSAPSSPVRRTTFVEPRKSFSAPRKLRVSSHPLNDVRACDSFSNRGTSVASYRSTSTRSSSRRLRDPDPLFPVLMESCLVAVIAMVITAYVYVEFFDDPLP